MYQILILPVQGIVLGSNILPSRYCHRVPHTSLGIAVWSHIHIILSQGTTYSLLGIFIGSHITSFGNFQLKDFYPVKLTKCTRTFHSRPKNVKTCNFGLTGQIWAIFFLNRIFFEIITMEASSNSLLFFWNVFLNTIFRLWDPMTIPKEVCGTVRQYLRKYVRHYDNTQREVPLARQCSIQFSDCGTLGQYLRKYVGPYDNT